MSRPRDWTVAVFVVWRAQVLLHRHPKLQRWLPCGGHIEAGELPDEAAVREVWEEAGVEVELIGPSPIEAPGPRQLVVPRAIQLERIDDHHDHIDLVYFAVPKAGYQGELGGEGGMCWLGRAELCELELEAEISAWCTLALDELG
jgi:8-oxo-dGTP pyrophosphatase MutT (NUDIX family)